MANFFAFTSKLASQSTTANREERKNKQAIADAKKSGESPAFHRMQGKLLKHSWYQLPNANHFLIDSHAKLYTDPTQLKQEFFESFLSDPECQITISLHISLINDGDNPMLMRMLASFLDVRFGVLHVALEIGDTKEKHTSIIIEWTDEDTVIPRKKLPWERYIFTHALRPDEQSLATRHQHSSSTESADKHDDDTSPRYTRGGEDFESTLTSDDLTSQLNTKLSKQEIIDKIVEVIVTYNSQYDYHRVIRNCQVFAEEIMTVIMTKVNIGYYMRNYLKSLMKGKLKIEFASHEDLDDVVDSLDKRSELRYYTLDELEFLQAQYQQFHYEQGKEEVNIANWECQVNNCRLPLIREMIERKLKNTS